MALMAQMYALSGLEAELGRDRRTLARLLASVPPDGKTSSGRDGWLIRTVLDAVARDEGKELLNPAAEKARLDKARADLAELQLATQRGLLIPAGLVESAWARVRDEVRKALLAVPGKTAPRVHGTMQTAAVEAVIREQIDEALASLASVEIKPEPIDGDDAGQSGPDQGGD